MALKHLSRIWLMTTLVLVVGCQAPRGGGGGGYKPQSQPAPHNPNEGQVGTMEGRINRNAGGANAGAYGNPPPGGERGAGSYYRSPEPGTWKAHYASPSVRPSHP
jgi:hypothetical protein